MLCYFKILKLQTLLYLYRQTFALQKPKKHPEAKHRIFTKRSHDRSIFARLFKVSLAEAVSVGGSEGGAVMNISLFLYICKSFLG